MTSCLWYRAVLCDSLIAAHQIPMLREHSADALGAAGWPDGACLFLTGHRTAEATPGQDEGAVPEAVFFSPVAIAAVPHLIVVCGAEPSPGLRNPSCRQAERLGSLAARAALMNCATHWYTNISQQGRYQ